MSTRATAKNTTQTGYASVNGLKMYYEIHGAGEPLIVLHGAYMSIVTMGEIIPRLAASRQVIAVELQGHGRTADIDRPLHYEAMADDIAGLMREIGIESADIFGYSMGGAVAMQVAIRHPKVVRKLIVASAGYNSAAMHPGMMEMLDTITPELFAGTPWEADYLNLAPDPAYFPMLVEKLTRLDTEIMDWPRESIQEINAPTMIIMGDADIIQPEHGVEMLRLRGGAVNGDLAGIPNARLAILPGTTHLGVISRVDWIIPMIVEFLDAATS